MTILAAGAADSGVGWGRLVGLLIGALLCFLYWRFDPKRDRGSSDGNPSPTDGAPPSPREIAQVGRVSSHVSPDETPPESHWYGRIERVGGSLRRVYGAAGHIARTGNSPPRESDEEPPADDVPEWALEGRERVIDIPLDDEPPAEPVVRKESREEFARRCLKGGVAEAQVVAALQEHYDVSRATAYRIVAAERPAGPRRVA